MKKLSIFLAVAVMIFCPAGFGQELQNGAFDTGLSGWTTGPAGTDAVVWYSEAAVLLNPGDFPLDPAWPLRSPGRPSAAGDPSRAFNRPSK